MKLLLKKSLFIISSIIFLFNINLIYFSIAHVPDEPYATLQESKISPCCILEDP